MSALTMLDRLVRLAAALTRAFMLLLAAVLFVIVIVTVVTRYGFNFVLSWSEEVPRYLLVWISLLGAALAVHHQEHIGFDYFFTRMPASVRAPLRVVLNLGIGAMGVIMLVYGIDFVHTFGADGMESIPFTNIWFYISLPISGALIALFVLNQEAHALDAMLRRRQLPDEPPPEHTVNL